MKRRAGHTLIEILVVAVIMSIVSTVVVGIYIFSTSSFSHTMGKIDLQGHTRELMKRMGPLVVSGIRPDASFPSAIMEPTQLNQEAASVILATTEDYLSNPTSSPPNRCALWTSIPSPLPVFYYRLRQDPLSGSVSLEKMQKNNNGAFTQVGSGRALLRAEGGRIKVTRLGFNRLTLNALQVHVELTGTYRNTKRQQSTIQYMADSIIQMPTVTN